MKSSHLLAVAALAASAALAGCYTPQPRTVYGSEDLPKVDWYTLSENSSEVQSLDPVLQNALTRQRQVVESEMSSRGELSADTKKSIADLNESCNHAYLVSFDMIASNPTPELNGQFESWDRRRLNDSMIFNQNLRATADSWSRFWLMDQPDPTPYATVNTTGRF